MRNIAILEWGPPALAFQTPFEKILVRSPGLMENGPLLPPWLAPKIIQADPQSHAKVRYCFSAHENLNKAIMNLKRCWNFPYAESIGFINVLKRKHRCRVEHLPLLERLRHWAVLQQVDALIWVDVGKPSRRKLQERGTLFTDGIPQSARDCAPFQPSFLEILQSVPRGGGGQEDSSSDSEMGQGGAEGGGISVGASTTREGVSYEQMPGHRHAHEFRFPALELSAIQTLSRVETEHAAHDIDFWTKSAAAGLLEPDDFRPDNTRPRGVAVLARVPLSWRSLPSQCCREVLSPSRPSSPVRGGGGAHTRPSSERNFNNNPQELSGTSMSVPSKMSQQQQQGTHPHNQSHSPKRTGVSKTPRQLLDKLRDSIHRRAYQRPEQVAAGAATDAGGCAESQREKKPKEKDQQEKEKEKEPGGPSVLQSSFMEAAGDSLTGGTPFLQNNSLDAHPHGRSSKRTWYSVTTSLEFQYQNPSSRRHLPAASLVGRQAAPFAPAISNSVLSEEKINDLHATEMAASALPTADANAGGAAASTQIGQASSIGMSGGTKSGGPGGLSPIQSRSIALTLRGPASPLGRVREAREVRASLPSYRQIHPTPKGGTRSVFYKQRLYGGRTLSHPAGSPSVLPFPSPSTRSAPLSFAERRGSLLHSRKRGLSHVHSWANIGGDKRGDDHGGGVNDSSIQSRRSKQKGLKSANTSTQHKRSQRTDAAESSQTNKLTAGSTSPQDFLISANSAWAREFRRQTAHTGGRRKKTGRPNGSTSRTDLTDDNESENEELHSQLQPNLIPPFGSIYPRKITPGPGRYDWSKYFEGGVKPLGLIGRCPKNFHLDKDVIDSLWKLSPGEYGVQETTSQKLSSQASASFSFGTVPKLRLPRPNINPTISEQHLKGDLLLDTPGPEYLPKETKLTSRLPNASSWSFSRAPRM